jgi:tripeptidyl-peptidase-1
LVEQFYLRYQSPIIMLYLSSLLAVAIAAQAALATLIKARTAYEVKEVHQVPRKWSSQGRAPSNHMLHMQIGLNQDKFDELERHLYEGKMRYLLPLN